MNERARIDKQIIEISCSLKSTSHSSDLQMHLLIDQILHKIEIQLERTPDDENQREENRTLLRILSFLQEENY